jgi:hypothetical protein
LCMLLDCPLLRYPTKKDERRKELMLQIRMKVLSGFDFWKVLVPSADTCPSIQEAHWMKRRRWSVSV